jgi:hypothetical protein
MRIYFDADAQPYVDDLAPTPAPVAPVRRRQRRGLRNWALCMVPIMAGGTMFLWGWEGSVYLNPATAMVGLAVWLSTMLIIFVLASRAGRL